MMTSRFATSSLFFDFPWQKEKSIYENWESVENLSFCSPFGEPIMRLLCTYYVLFMMERIENDYETGLLEEKNVQIS